MRRGLAATFAVFSEKSRAKVRKIAELRHPARCELGFWGDDMADCCGCGAGCVGCVSVSMPFRCCHTEISDRGGAHPEGESRGKGCEGRRAAGYKAPQVYRHNASARSWQGLALGQMLKRERSHLLFDEKCSIFALAKEETVHSRRLPPFLSPACAQNYPALAKNYKALGFIYVPMA